MDNLIKVYVGDGQTKEVLEEAGGIVYSDIHDKYIFIKGAIQLAESTDLMVNHSYDLDKQMRFVNEDGEAEKILPDGFLSELDYIKRAIADGNWKDEVKMIVAQLKAAIKRELTSMVINDNDYEITGFSVNVTQGYEGCYFAEVLFCEEMTYTNIFDEENHLNIARYLADESNMKAKLYKRLLEYVAGKLLNEDWIFEEKD